MILSKMWKEKDGTLTPLHVMSSSKIRSIYSMCFKSIFLERHFKNICDISVVLTKLYWRYKVYILPKDAENWIPILESYAKEKGIILKKGRDFSPRSRDIIQGIKDIKKLNHECKSYSGGTNPRSTVSGNNA